ncbi:MAG: HK97-gp10 family putative phage morphogenesis protein [Methanomassiliicoccales archaeon]
MVQVSVTIKGLDELAAKLQHLGEEVRTKAKEEIMTSALEIESRAKELCPVDTGRLRSSIRTDSSTEGEELGATVFTDVDYAPYIELGTSRMAAQPFLVPAVEQVAPQMIRNLETIIQNATEKVGD